MENSLLFAIILRIFFMTNTHFYMQWCRISTVQCSARVVLVSILGICSMNKLSCSPHVLIRNKKRILNIDGFFTLLKVRKSRNDFFEPTFLPKTKQMNSILLLWNLRLTCFCSFFGGNWRHQKNCEIKWPLALQFSISGSSCGAQ